MEFHSYVCSPPQNLRFFFRLVSGQNPCFVDLSVLNPSAEDFAAIRKIHGRIDSVIHARGKSYASPRRILRLDRSGDELLAEVEGNFIYTTILNQERAKATCTCPAPKPCKQIAGPCAYLIARENEQQLFSELAACQPQFGGLPYFFSRGSENYFQVSAGLR